MRLQARLAGRVLIQPLRREPRWIAGLDAAFSPDDSLCLGAVVVWDRLAGREAESHVVACPLRFPYVPGLLSFREAPALLKALRRLRIRPDLLMCDGQGLAHPRRFGLACHIGILADLPALGCAKSVLVGAAQPLAPDRGSISDLIDQSQIVGRVVRTRDGVRPVIVSVGHRLTLTNAVHVTLRCCLGRRLPEPTRLADALVSRARKDWQRAD